MSFEGTEDTERDCFIRRFKAMNDPLIFGKMYHCWREGLYLGTSTYTDDDNIGPSFQVMVVLKSGELAIEVVIPDQWELNVTV